MSDKLAVITQWLEISRPSFDEMNLNSLDFAKEKEFMIQAFQANPYLMSMEENSIRNILINCALTGLTLSPVMKQAYPVPRKGKLCLDVSYMGMIKIVTDTGSVKSIKSSVVYSNEPFDIELGSDGYVKHKPNLTSTAKGTKLGAYSIAVLNDGSHHIHWMYAQDIEAIKARSESVKAKKQSPWDSDPDEMWKKTVIKQHYKYLPKSERAQMASHAINFENETNGIDFEKEQKKSPKTAHINISDFLDPDVEEDLAGFNKMGEMFNREDLPATVMVDDVAYNLKEKWSLIEESFLAKNLLKEKARNWFKFIMKVVKEQELKTNKN